MLTISPVAYSHESRCEGELTELYALDANANPIPGGYDKYKDYKVDSHIRRYIKLHEAVPVLNPLTSGQQYIKAARLLGCSKTQLEEIADFRTVWDLSTNCLMSVEQCEKPLFNGAAVSVMIDNLAIEATIQDILEALANKAMPKGHIPHVNRRGEGYPFYGPYHIEVVSMTGEVDPVVWKKLDAVVERSIGNGAFGRVNMLINIMNAHGWNENRAKEYLKHILLVTVVMVIPYTMRPSLDGRKHPMTVVYSRLFQANTEVYMYLNGRYEDFKEHYRKIAQLVQSLMTDNRFENSDLKSLDPMLKRIKGKNGMIRSTMLKKRQDYSGRSAVIVDPFLPVNCIGLPKTMAVRMFRRYITRECKVSASTVLQKINDPEFIEHVVKLLERTGVLAEVPVLLGRNPTLHKHGIQGFKIVITDGRAIKVNPLVCPAFNMDFDGDAAHDEVPQSPQAQYEIRKLIMTDKNIILPKTGACTLCPEKDVVYGLYVCTLDYQQGGSGGSYPDASALRHALFNQEVMVWDNVTVGGLGSGLAGRLAFNSCFPAKIANSIEVRPVDQGFIKECIKKIQTLPTTSFDNCVNSLVELGMKIAYLYNKSVSVLAPLNKNEEFDTVIGKFEKEMEEVYELSDFGFYDTDSFEADFSGHLAVVDKTLKDRIYDKMPDNMFKDMAISGARGSAGNLVQMFGSKGRIQKSESEAFNIFIKHGMYKQLTPMDQAISAHGARRGQISKSIKTADTGYLNRRLCHAVAGCSVITEEDCGTRDGVVISFDDIKARYVTETMSEEDIVSQYDKIEKTMVKFIVGRYQTANNMKITEAEAVQIAATHKSVRIRSPLTCNNPCCAKCYGTYVETGKLPPVGFPIGFISATSMAEPSTQLVMKEFQKGGVVGAASPFDRLNSQLCCDNIRQKAAQGEYPTYDPVAWAPGVLKKEDFNSTLVVLRIVPEGEPNPSYDYKVTRLAPNTAKYRVDMHVEPGETLRVAHGDSYIAEVEKFAGLRRAQTELLYSLYFLFKSQVDLLPVYFEVVIAAMTGYMPVRAKSPKLRYGKYYTKRLLCDIGIGVDSLQDFSAKICGVDKIVLGSPNFMEAFIMEDQREALSEAALNCLYDAVDSPLVQLALGQRVKVGTGYSSTFLEDIG